MAGLFSIGFTLVGFWLVLTLVYLQYRRVSSLEAQTLGAEKRSPLVRTMVSLVAGVLGGILGSFIYILLGASIGEMGLGFIWIVALSLAVFNLRLICFAYAGGIVSLSALVLGWPRVDIPAIMSLVGVLHLVESVLILAMGHLDTTPVLIPGPGGRPRGVCLLQKFWPIPVVVGMMVSLPLAEMPPEVLHMPDWWPLVKPSLPTPEGMEAIFAVIAVTAATGYGDFTYTRTPRQKATLTACASAVFSLVLLGLAVLSASVPAVRWAAALFSPLGHEAVIFLARRVEQTGTPLFDPVPSGLRVLDVLPGSPASAAGIKAGDIILSVNCQPISTIPEFLQGLSAVPYAALLEVESTSRVQSRARRGLGDASLGGTRTVQIKIRGKDSELGLVFVPREGPVRMVRLGSGGLAAMISRWLGRRLWGGRS
jgi:hypothetical protein